MRPKLNLSARVTLVTTALCITFSQHLPAADPLFVGGSNYAWYSVDQSVLNNNEDRNCREQFGIIANYHQQQVKSTVKQQLASMFRNGQRKLRVPIFHANDLTTGTVLSSAGGNLTAQARNNLANFLADIKSAGFQEILVGFFPISRSNPGNWYREFGTGNTASRTWFFDSATLEENWNLIRNLRPLIVGANMIYKIDLLNEGAASSTQPVSRQYTGELWSRYNAAYGKSDTVGFSVATGSRVEAANPNRNVIGDLAADRYNTMKQVYDESGFGAPNVWDFHFYDDLDRKFRKVDAAMNAQGDNTDIIIGETYYQDLTTLSSIQNISTNREIRSIYAWPVTTARGCDGHADIPFPDEYHYQPRLTNADAPQQPAVTPQQPAVVTPVVQQPAVVAPVVQQPAVVAPVVQQPAVVAPVVQQPAVVAPVVQQPAVVAPVVQQPSAVPQAPVAVPAVQESATASLPFTVCTSANSDSDGDGWGWENNASCRVTVTSTPVVAATPDPVVTETVTPVTATITGTPICQMANSDPDGDGYGWENNASCRVDLTSASGAMETSTTTVTVPTGTPICQRADSDADGDGYGWENQSSCIVSDN